MISNAHGCDPNNIQNCGVNYIQQLSSNHSSYVVTNGADHLIKLWQLNVADSDDGNYLIPQCTLSGHTDAVTQTLEITSVSDRLASASKDGTVRIWSISKCKQVGSTITVGSAVNALENYPIGGTTIVSGDDEGRILIWDVTSGTQSTFATLASSVNDLWLLGATNQYLGAATGNNCNPTCTLANNDLYDQGSLWLFNVASPGFDAHTALTASQKFLYFVYGDTFLADALSLDLTTGSTSAHTNSVNVIDSIQEISDQFATASSDGHTKVWSITNKNLAETSGCHTGAIYSSLDHVANPNIVNQYWLIDGSQDTNVNTYVIPSGGGNPLVGVYRTGQVITSLKIVNESNGRVRAFVGLITFAFLLARLF